MRRYPLMPYDVVSIRGWFCEVEITTANATIICMPGLFKFAWANITGTWLRKAGLSSSLLYIRASPTARYMYLFLSHVLVSLIEVRSPFSIPGDVSERRSTSRYFLKKVVYGMGCWGKGCIAKLAAKIPCGQHLHCECIIHRPVFIS